MLSAVVLAFNLIYVSAASFVNVIDFVSSQVAVIPPAEAVKAISDALKSLEYIHSKDIIHRDIKLPNIFLKNGNAILGDMGLAKRQKELST